jgi:tetratricopeptide (TPR) repeat protein
MKKVAIAISILMQALMCRTAIAQVTADGAGGDSRNSELIKRAMSANDIGCTLSINGVPLRYDYSSDDKKRADEIVSKSLMVARYSPGDNSSMLATALDVAGVMYYRSGDLCNAKRCFADSLELKRKFARASELAIGCQLLAQIHRARGEYPQAQVLYEEASRLNKQEFGSNSFEARRTLGDLASAYSEGGDVAKAKEVQQRLASMSAAAGSDAKVANGAAENNGELSANFGGVTQLAMNIISAHELEAAEHNAEREALQSLKTGIVPARNRDTVAMPSFRQSYQRDDSAERIREAEQRLADEQENMRKLMQEQQAKLADEQRIAQRQRDEARMRAETDEASRRLEAQQAALQAQREAAGTGTSYFSRYH